MKDEEKIQQYYKVLTETSPDCIKLFDLNGNILYLNPGGQKEHGLNSLEEATGKKLIYYSSSIQSKDRNKFEKAIKDAVSGKSSTIEINHIEGKSTRESCLETISPVKDKKGNVIAIFGVSRDITKLKKTERELLDIQKSLEFKILEQTKDLKDKVDKLERMNRLMVGRELELIKLKKEIEKLKKVT